MEKWIWVVLIVLAFILGLILGKNKGEVREVKIPVEVLIERELVIPQVRTKIVQLPPRVINQTRIDTIRDTITRNITRIDTIYLDSLFGVQLTSNHKLVNDSLEIEMRVVANSWAQSPPEITIDSLILERFKWVGVVNQEINLPNSRRSNWGLIVGPTIAAGWDSRTIRPVVGVGLTFGWQVK